MGKLPLRWGGQIWARKDGGEKGLRNSLFKEDRKGAEKKADAWALPSSQINQKLSTCLGAEPLLEKGQN